MASFFPGLLRSFGPAQPAQAPAPGGQQAPAAGPAPAFNYSNMQQQPQQQPAPQPGGQGPSPDQPQQPVSPLDGFNQLWETPSNPDPNAPQDPWTQPLLSADPTKIMEMASRHDFTRNIPPELLQKATSGDMSALLQIINQVGQQAMGASIQVSAASVEHGGTKLRSQFDGVFADRFRQQQLDSIQPTNPALAHPAAQPVLKDLRKQIATNNPKMSPQEVNAKAEAYFMALSQSVIPPAPAPAPAPGTDQDWMAWGGQN